MTFHVGQRVVCISRFDDDPDGYTTFPRRGQIYTVRTVEAEDGREWLRLHEIFNDPSGYEEGIEGRFWSARFRPVVERTTDISIFRWMLTGAPNETEAAE